MSELRNLSNRRSEYNRRYYAKNRERILAQKKKLTLVEPLSTNHSNTSSPSNTLIGNGSAQQTATQRTSEPLHAKDPNYFDTGKPLIHNGSTIPVSVSTSFRVCSCSAPKAALDFPKKEKNMHIVPAAPALESKEEIKAPKSKWADLKTALCDPGAVFLLLITTLLTTIMSYQAVLFFEFAGESHPFVAAIVAELLLVLGSTCLVLYEKGLVRVLIWVGLLAFIGVYGAGLYQTYKDKAVEALPAISELERKISDTETEIQSARAERDALPTDYKTRREHIFTQQIQPAQQRIEKLTIELRNLQASQKSSASVVSYSLLRVLMMLLNGLLVHRLAKKLIKFEHD